MSFFSTVGRMALSTIFVQSGVNGLQNPGFVAQAVEQAGLPEPELLEKAHHGINAVAGTTMALGILPRLSALLLAGNLVPATVIGHNPNDADDPMDKQAQTIHAAKNISLLGALLMVTGRRSGGDDEAIAELEDTVRELTEDDEG